MLVNRSFTPPPPSSFYNTNSDIDTKGQTTWCVALLEMAKAVVTYLFNILIDFAKHRIVVHGKVTKGSDRFRGPPGF